MVVGQFSRWVTAYFRTPPRTVVVTKVDEANDDVFYMFEDTRGTSVCSQSAFLRTFKPLVVE